MSASNAAPDILMLLGNGQVQSESQLSVCCAGHIAAKLRRQSLPPPTPFEGLQLGKKLCQSAGLRVYQGVYSGNPVLVRVRARMLLALLSLSNRRAMLERGTAEASEVVRSFAECTGSAPMQNELFGSCAHAETQQEPG